MYFFRNIIIRISNIPKGIFPFYEPNLHFMLLSQMQIKQNEYINTYNIILHFKIKIKF